VKPTPTAGGRSARAGGSSDDQWIDVDLGEQVLVAYRGTTPVYVTLVSSGKGSPTPKGNYPIWAKVASMTMANQDYEDNPYMVEHVPWVMLFQGHNALHGAYWHDQFGKRRSHGCVNLSPKDAARVYALTSPNVPPGWNSLLEHKGDPGTLVRVRRGTEPVTDRRLPLGEVDATEDTEG
jgi:hypothetical protein